MVMGLLGLLAVGGYLGLVAPKYREIRMLKAQLARGETERRVVREQQRSVPPVGEEERKLWKQLEARLRDRFPPEQALPSALEAVADLARSAGMQLVSLNLQSPPSDGEASRGRRSRGPSRSERPRSSSFRVPRGLTASPLIIRLRAVHRYRHLVRFLEGLRSLSMYVAVESVQVQHEDGQLGTEMQLRTFRWGK